MTVVVKLLYLESTTVSSFTLDDDHETNIFVGISQKHIEAIYLACGLLAHTVQGALDEAYTCRLYCICCRLQSSHRVSSTHTKKENEKLHSPTTENCQRVDVMMSWKVLGFQALLSKTVESTHVL